MSLYNFKRVQVVPTAKDFVDIVLSKTQRKTPTVVHQGYPITRLRHFYMRKVKFTQQTFHDKLSHILDDFPKIEEIHPFYADLMNILYDKDHYKLALSQVNTARHLIDGVAKDYVKLLKFGDSLYRCKQLKKAALGRMCTIMRKQGPSLAYLEQVRQHLARLPSIDPNTRTLLICGYPNVGKSSFLNKITRAEVEVHSYAFTTKSLFVGHTDYKYLRWQVIDTPGILDHPLEDRNTIEMQSITALAHLRACILYFVDLSEQCGYTIQQQVNLFHNIKPLFANKPIVLVVNKMDVRSMNDLNVEERRLVQSVLDEDVELVETSCYTEEGVMNVKQVACDKLLETRVEMKMKGRKVNDVLNRLHLAIPTPRDDKQRPSQIPEMAIKKPLYDTTDPMRPKLEKDLELEEGGPGVYSMDYRKQYLLENTQWNYDIMPEIMDGHNVADFVDPDIAEKLDALEREEERLEHQGYYHKEETMDSDEDDVKKAVNAIREKKKLIVQAHRLARGKNRPSIPKKTTALHASKHLLEEHLTSLGLETDAIHERDLTHKRKRLSSRSRADEIVRNEERSQSRGRSQSRSESVMGVKKTRAEMGLKNVEQKVYIQRLARQSQSSSNLQARKGESDRKILNMMPKHLFSGKRTVGKTDRR